MEYGGPSYHPGPREGTSSQKSKRNETTVSFFEYKRDHHLSWKSYLPHPFGVRIPFELIMKVMLSSIGIIAEAFINVVKDDGHSHLTVNVYRVHTEN